LKRVLTAILILTVCFGVPCADGQALRENAEQARGILKAGVEASDALVRVEAINAVGMIGDHELVLTRLEQLLND
jgi:HEAT repeat protein